jgi:hypothetical protein
MRRRVTVVGFLTAMAALVGGTGAGATLPVDGGPVDLVADASLRIDGVNAGDLLGISISRIGDVNGDGFDDLAVGAPGYGPSGLAGAGPGAVFVVFGASHLAGIDLAHIAGHGFRIDGSTASPVGVSVTDAGDVNGDGLDDVAVGAPEAGFNARAGAGSVYVVYGGSGSGNVDLANLGSGGLRIDGAVAGDRLGATVASVGDVNGDGRPDLAIGAPGATTVGRAGSGAVTVLLGAAHPASIDLASLGARGYVIAGPAAGDGVGAALAVAAAGDIDGDGYADIAIGDRRAEGGAGNAFVVRGAPTVAAVDLGAVASARVLRLRGAAAGDLAGWSVAGVGDVNGDGRDDLVVGAPGVSTVRAGAGRAYVVLGSSSPTGFGLGAISSHGFAVDGAVAQEFSGEVVAPAGDLNGDGRPDIVIGAPEAGTIGTSYVLFGSSSAGSNVDLAALGARGFRLDGPGTSSFAGNAFASVTGFDGDGRAALIVADGNGDLLKQENSGSVFVIDGFVGGPVRLGRPVVAGSTALGSTLTASDGEWLHPSALAFRFRWRRCLAGSATCVPITGATTATHVTTAADLGHRLVVEVEARNGFGLSAVVESLPTSPVYQLPVLVYRPAIRGIARAGHALRCTAGTWLHAVSYTFRWLRDGRVPLGSSARHVVVKRDVGHRLGCRVTASSGTATARADTRMLMVTR